MSLTLKPLNLKVSYNYRRVFFQKLGRGPQQQISKSNWIYVLDSGGQPQFADVSRAFVRGNTVKVIVHKLTDRLSTVSSKRVFQYSIKGEALTQPRGIKKSSKVSLPVVRKPPCLETEIVDDSQNTYVEPMLASPRVKTTAEHSRENEHEQYNV